jgi:hypothetical protein
MNNLIAKLGAVAAGALAMYYLDPQMGAQRRALFGELLASGLPGRGGRREAGGGQPSRRTYHRPAKADPQADAQLRDEIRSRLGRLVSHPGALDVSVEHGVVRLSGNVLAKERDGLLEQVREIPGVQKLLNAMTAHDSPEGIAESQGKAASTGRVAA